MRAKRLIAAASAAALTVGIVVIATPASAVVDICKAKNVTEAGGMDNLVKLAKKEGKLALITTPGGVTCATTSGPISIESGCFDLGAVFIVSISYCDDPSGLSTVIFTPNAFSYAS